MTSAELAGSPAPEAAPRPRPPRRSGGTSCTPIRAWRRSSSATCTSASSAGMAEKFGKILVPMEEVVEPQERQEGRLRTPLLPGYVLVEMDMDDDTWHLVKHTAKVTGFVGGAKNRPAPISEAEVNKIVHQMQEGVEKPRPKVQWVVGELVRVKEGPFTDFNGAIEDVNYDKSKVACR